MNLLKNPPKYHRELFTIESNVRTAKTSYTALDMWKYYNLLFLQKGEAVRAVPTKEERQKRRDYLLSTISPLTPEVEKMFTDWCKTYGLEVVLIAIDNYMQQDTPTFPSVTGVIYCLKPALAQFNRSQKRIAI
mgnify:CR=1 FL=1